MKFFLLDGISLLLLLSVVSRFSTRTSSLFFFFSLTIKSLSTGFIFCFFFLFDCCAMHGVFALSLASFVLPNWCGVSQGDLLAL